MGWVDVQFGNALAVVCDGCSASPDVDFGARILAKAAENTILNLGTDSQVLGNASLFGVEAIGTASRIFNIFNTLHPQALDSTLLVAMVDKNKKLNAYLYGDGVLVHRKNTGVNTVHIALSSGAPDYLSYNLDSARMEGYLSLENNVKEIACTTNGKTIQINGKPLEPYVLSCEVSEGDVIAVISDGINSFRKSNNDPIPWSDLVEEFTGYKNFEGEFVQRRIAAFKRKCLKEGITHSDDISVASIIV